jgi:hypothetical protein
MRKLKLSLAAVLVVLWLLTPGTRIATAQTPSTPQVTTHWHEPTTHEHGDAEPEWLVQMFLAYPQLQSLFGADATGHLAYDVPFNTSPAENAVSGKHFAMKGFHLNYSPDKAAGFHGLDGSWLEGYARVHLSSTPVDRGARFHSAAVFIVGNGKLLAIRQGWLDTGNVDTARVPEYCTLTGSTNTALRTACNPYDAFQRPIVFTVTPDSLTGKYTGGIPHYQEQWYPVGLGFSWAWGISDAATVEQMGEKATDYDISKWGVVRGANGQQSVGLLRQLDLSARAIPLHDTLFYTTQFGDYVADPKSAECQSPNICLIQYYNDFPGIEGRSIVTDFPGRGKVTIPN